MCGRDRGTEQITLHFVAADCGQQVALCLGLYPLGDDTEVETLAQGDNRLGEGDIAGVLRYVADKRTVDVEIEKASPDDGHLLSMTRQTRPD